MTVTEAIQRGWSVIPVGLDKKPLIESWKPYQSHLPSANDIAGWRGKKPAGWAVITGNISGIFTLDFDGEAGLATMRRLNLEPHRRSPSGGCHVDFVYPGWRIATLNCKTDGELKKRWPGLDCRGDGGYVVFTGRNQAGAYQWLRDSAPYSVDQLPADLVAYLRYGKAGLPKPAPAAPAAPSSTNGRVTTDILIRKALEMARANGRNNSGFWLACQLRDNGYSQPEAESTLRYYAALVPDTNTKGKREPYLEADAQASVQQAYQSASREPWTPKPKPPVHQTLPEPPDAPDAPEPPLPKQRRPDPAEERSIFESVSPYPEPITSTAYIGIAGEFVHQVEQDTEADPSFLLVSFLAAAGNLFGRRSFVWAGADRHYPNLFVCAVGPTASGRKGSAFGPVQLFFDAVDPAWNRLVQSGLSSGEGLIWAVHDPVIKREKLKGAKGQPERYEDVCVDAGVSDKRLLVRQSEFYGALQAMRRQGNTLSPTMRDAWDRGNLNTMTKNNQARATAAHISIIANITREELLRGMTSEEADNGFANRFLWICSHRARLLPDGGKMEQAVGRLPFTVLLERFKRANDAIQCRAIHRTQQAGDLWGHDDDPEAGLYGELSRERHGLFAVCTARAPAQVLRLALIYALLDEAMEIHTEHLLAAREIWRYAEESAAYIFGDAVGDPLADELRALLRKSNEGLTRTEINNLFDRHRSSAEIQRALMVLHQAGLAKFTREQGRGRAVERWFSQ
jgi:hypothetical protein